MCLVLQIRNWIRDKSDSLVIVSHFHPTAVLINLMPTLAPAAPFVVFSEYLEVRLPRDLMLSLRYPAAITSTCLCCVRLCSSATR